MAETIIQTVNLKKQYNDQLALRNVSLHVRRGRIYGLLGRNGAGKTTCMKMIMGLTEITSGEISIFNTRLRGNEKTIYRRIGCMIESPGFYPNLTGAENLAVFTKLRGSISRTAIKDALEIVGLPFGDKKLFSNYSMGMKQRLGIANAIIHDPELLILDEPTNGLDPIGIAELRAFFKTLCKERGKTILISSHILSEISLLADDIGIINDGVLLEEASLEHLEQKNSMFVHFIVSDAALAACVLEQQFHTTNFQISENNLRLYDTSLPVTEINRCLIENGIGIMDVHTYSDTLEDYFKKLTGGEGIA